MSETKLYSRACIGLQKATQTVGELLRLIWAPFMLSERRTLLKQKACLPVFWFWVRVFPRSLRRDRMTGCSEEPDSSPDSLRSVAEERQRKSNIASGPPYVYLIFQLGPICRACGSSAVLASRSISNTSDSNESVDSTVFKGKASHRCYRC